MFSSSSSSSSSVAEVRDAAPVIKGSAYFRMLGEQKNKATPRVKVVKDSFDLIGATDEQLRAHLRTMQGFERCNMSYGLCLKSRSELEKLYFEHHPRGIEEWRFVNRERSRAQKEFEEERLRDIRDAAAAAAKAEAEEAEKRSLDAEEAAEKAAHVASVAAAMGLEVIREEAAPSPSASPPPPEAEDAGPSVADMLADFQAATDS